MKKFLTCLLVVAMIVAMATTAFAAKAGEEVTVNFTTSGNPGFACFGANISYDKEALELTKIEKGALFGGMFEGNPAADMAGGFNSDDITGDGVLFTATFKIKEGAKAGDYAVTAALDLASTSNAAMDDVSFGLNGGTITVEGEATEPTEAPTTEPTEAPTTEPTEAPTTEPTEAPTTEPTEAPTTEPTEAPTTQPTEPKPVDPSEPNTGDNVPMVVMTAIAVVCAIAAAAFVTKRRIAK